MIEMENEEEKTISDATPPPPQRQAPVGSSPSHSYNRQPERKSPVPRGSSVHDSPAKSSVSSNQSHQTSLSHGSSHRDVEFPASPPYNPPGNMPAKPLSPVRTVNRSVRDEPITVTKFDFAASTGVREESFGETKEEREAIGRRSRPSLSIPRRTKKETMVKKAALGFRICGFLFGLISLSVMAADRNQGWALDSFHRYKEFRYCISVNVIAFIYSGAQACDLAYHLATGNYVVRQQFRFYFDFGFDQMLTYLLMSASSSAATRVDDWKLNWGEDKFPAMASASVAMSFIAFVALASSALISGYALLCSFKST